MHRPSQVSDQPAGLIDYEKRCGVSPREHREYTCGAVTSSRFRLQISTRNAADEDYFLLGAGEGEAELFCGAAPTGAIDEGTGVDSWDFFTSMILVLIVASLVKGELG